jgi:hypothetical protein
MERTFNRPAMTGIDYGCTYEPQPPVRKRAVAADDDEAIRHSETLSNGIDHENDLSFGVA